MSRNLAAAIHQKAMDLGYENCGIISVDQMKGYGDKLSERIRAFTDTKRYLEGFYAFCELDKNNPWAKSVVVCVRHYGKYHIPEHLKGLIAKYYLVDSREDRETQEYKDSVAFEGFLLELGLKVASERKFGITALRWAAMQAGLGVVRKNNFFYTGSGSWVHLEGWLIDEEAELIQTNTLKPCPDSCDLCVRACPTNSLTGPYLMNRSACVSCLTAWSGWDLTKEPLHGQMRTWIYGCEACQNICPHNQNAWTSEEEFPHLKELGEAISLEKMIEMDYNFLENVIQPKFWYIRKDRVWKWKINALNAMLNDYSPAYEKYIELALTDEVACVRDMAAWVKEQIPSLQ